MYKVSVIIPAYNAENEICRCIDSILQQTFRDFEIILIDDGSKDRTREICEEYANKDNRIHFFSQSNKGVAATRNRGIDLAKGEWITFVDADDYLDNRCLEESYRLADENEVDIVLWNLQNEYENGKVVELKPLNGDVRFFLKTDIQKIESMMLTRLSENKRKGQVENLIGPVCKLIHKDCIQEARFPEELDFGEDTCFSFQLIKNCNRLVYVSNCFYHRVVTKGSLTQNVQANMWQRRLKRLNWIVAFYGDEIHEREAEFNYFYYQDYRSLLINYFVTNNSLSNKERKKLISEYKKNQKHTIDYDKIDDWYKFVIKYDMFFVIQLAGVIKKIMKK